MYTSGNEENEFGRLFIFHTVTEKKKKTFENDENITKTSLTRKMNKTEFYYSSATEFDKGN